MVSESDKFASKSQLAPNITLLVVIITTALAQTEPFIMGGSAMATYTNWANETRNYAVQEESLGGNFVQLNCADYNYDVNRVKAALDSAAKMGLKVILNSAGRGQDSIVRRDTESCRWHLDLFQMSAGQMHRYEAESDLHAAGDVGRQVGDGAAMNASLVRNRYRRLVPIRGHSELGLTDADFSIS